MRKPQMQDDRRVSLMARDQYVRSVKWTPCAQEGEEEHLLQRLEQGNVERQGPDDSDQEAEPRQRGDEECDEDGDGRALVRPGR